ncbi:NAD(P)H-hydrate dehydratase [Candidatus Roizmanbacteria bacterium]|nr:NAD(P)H-hydrate dehydratase [Candidatus Roizmanbacteria bacterium]
MIVKTSDVHSIQPFLKRLHLPKPKSHKGQNGKVLIIGGSSLFHAASIWAAEVASHFADIVHYSSTKENNEIMLSLKKFFRNGIVIPHTQLHHYLEEDDAILVGPGMVRGKVNEKIKAEVETFLEILKIKDEASYSHYLTKYLLEKYPKKRFVFDAGALQMMDRAWLRNTQERPILTPHQKEFQQVFGINISEATLENKGKIVKEYAKKYRCVILLKAIVDIISDGESTVFVEGGNQGLTKGGTGDVLAGLALSLFARNDPLESAVLASFFLKKTADELYKAYGYWYNISDIINHLPNTVKRLVF